MKEKYFLAILVVLTIVSFFFDYAVIGALGFWVVFGLYKHGKSI